MTSTKHVSSPLRYPGGKSRISTFLVDLLMINNIEDCHFYELYAGGAGASLDLLFSKVVSRITLNDLDPHIYNFWKSVLNESELFIKLVTDTDINVETWKRQRQIYLDHESYSDLEIGFSTFYLNRCNRSGILYKAGPIGGMDQTGNYKIDVRFNKANLIKRLEKIADHSDLISIKNQETIVLIQDILKESTDNTFVFLDPPYYEQGENLYLNFYEDDDHLKLRNMLDSNRDRNWFLTYDNCKRINQLYSDFKKSDLPMSYTLQSKRKSKEVMVFSDSLHLPRNLRIGRKSHIFTLR